MRALLHEILATIAQAIGIAASRSDSADPMAGTYTKGTP
jgi:hypothetical protein